MENRTQNDRQSLYAEVTLRVIVELEAGRLPWAQPWDSAACGCTMPHSAGTGRRYADYVGSWLAVLREDEKAIFRAASAASKGVPARHWLSAARVEQDAPLLLMEG